MTGSLMKGSKTDRRVSRFPRRISRLDSIPLLNIPSEPVGPNASSMLGVRRNGTTSGRGSFNPLSKMLVPRRIGTWHINAETSVWVVFSSKIVARERVHRCVELWTSTIEQDSSCEIVKLTNQNLRGLFFRLLFPPIYSPNGDHLDQSRDRSQTKQQPSEWIFSWLHTNPLPNKSVGQTTRKVPVDSA